MSITSVNVQVAHRALPMLDEDRFAAEDGGCPRVYLFLLHDGHTNRYSEASRTLH